MTPGQKYLLLPAAILVLINFSQAVGAVIISARRKKIKIKSQASIPHQHKIGHWWKIYTSPAWPSVCAHYWCCLCGLPLCRDAPVRFFLSTPTPVDNVKWWILPGPCHPWASPSPHGSVAAAPKESPCLNCSEVFDEDTKWAKHKLGSN